MIYFSVWYPKRLKLKKLQNKTGMSESKFAFENNLRLPKKVNFAKSKWFQLTVSFGSSVKHVLLVSLKCKLF